MKEIFTELTKELVEATRIRDDLEVEYEFERAKLMFSASVNSLSNQAQREAQLTILMHESGWDRKVAEVRTNSRIAYYKWASIKSLIDKKGYDE